MARPDTGGALRARAGWLLVALLSLAGCSGDGAEPAQAANGVAAVEEPAERRPARILALPGSAQQGREPDLQGRLLHWDLPQGWIVEQPSSSMRLAQYRVPGQAGDAECVVFYFGPGQGGDPQSNATRWAGQFTQPDGSSSVGVMQFSRLEGAPVEVQLVEVTGTYDGGMTMTDAPAERQPDHMLLGAIVQGPDAPWFFKFTGPEATVRTNREAFEAMLGSIHTGD